MLRKIDILPLQVRIDAVIAEVTLNDNLQYGTQFFFKSGGINGILNFEHVNASQSHPGNEPEPELPRLLPRWHRRRRRAIRDPGPAAGHHGARAVLAGASGAGQPAGAAQVGNVVPYLSQTSQSTSQPTRRSSTRSIISRPASSCRSRRG